jgi:hypothetical protein
LQSAQKRFSLPCGQGLQSTQSPSACHAGRGCSPRSCFSLAMRAGVAVRTPGFLPSVRAPLPTPIARVPLRARPTAPADMTRSRQVVAVRVFREKRFRR